MDNDFLKRGIELCLAVYRVTNRLPENEILRDRMRAASIDISELLAYNKINPADSRRILKCEELNDKLDSLDVYFAVAKKQRWLNEKNFEVLRYGYKKLWADVSDNISRAGSPNQTEQISDGSGQAGPVRLNDINPSGLVPDGLTVGALDKPKRARRGVKIDFSEKQKNILNIVKANKAGITIGSVADSLKISKRTVARNLKYLIGKGAIKKSGKTKNLKFFVPDSQSHGKGM